MSKDGRRKEDAGKRSKKVGKTKSYVKKDENMMPAHDLIGRKLREYYDEVSREPIPDRFSALLDELAAKSGGKRS